MVCTYKQLSALIKRKIVSRKFNHLKKMSFGIDGGMYMGCPGKELFYSLPHLSETQRDNLIPQIAGLFPKEPPGRSVQYSVFWRYFYGCFDKQGTLNAKKGAKEVIADLPDWTLHDQFVNQVLAYLKKHKYLYAYVVCREMKSHRIGDEIIISQNKERVPELIASYGEVAKLAAKIKSRKNAFSSYYWLARYLYALECHLEFIKYAKLFLGRIDKWCETRLAQGKVVSTLNNLYVVMPPKEWNDLMTTYRSYTNPMFRKFKYVKLSCPHPYPEVLEHQAKKLRDQEIRKTRAEEKRNRKKKKKKADKK